jgi:hypothetical protein
MSKPTRIISIVLKVLVALMLVMSGVMKLSHSKDIVDGFTKAGLGDYITLIGVIELIAVVLYLIPKTSRLGFLLVTAYLGGAIVTQMATSQLPFASAIILAVCWISMFLTNKAMFLPVSESR